MDTIQLYMVIKWIVRIKNTLVNRYDSDGFVVDEKRY